MLEGGWAKWKCDEGQESNKERRKKAQKVAEMEDRQTQNNIHSIWVLRKDNETMEQS